VYILVIQKKQQQKNKNKKTKREHITMNGFPLKNYRLIIILL